VLGEPLSSKVDIRAEQQPVGELLTEVVVVAVMCRTRSTA